ncbi:MAG: exodeoxyribonuclease V subunit alpha [Acidimicrobiales bacterium]
MTAPTPLLGAPVQTLAPFVAAGVLAASDVQVAGVIARSVGGLEPEVVLGAALAARAPRLGHVCVVIGTVAGSVVVDAEGAYPVDTLPWPDAQRWAACLYESPAVGRPEDGPSGVVLPLVFDGTRLYLERYWRFEKHVAESLLQRAGSAEGFATSSPGLEAVLDELFEDMDRLQREAASQALTGRIAVIGGGPGTGKTRTVARLLAAANAVALARGEPPRVALAAPTGKAAARMTAAVHEEAEVANLGEGVADLLRRTEARTLHRLLGAHAGGKPRYDSSNPLPDDLVVVDETSMVSLPMMARLLDAVRPGATLVLVGDPYQLASVEAGAVLGEIVGPRVKGPAVGPLGARIVLLEHNHRFGLNSEIAAFADAVRLGEADVAMELLRDHGSGEVTWVGDEDRAGITRLHEEAAACAAGVVRAALKGDAREGLKESSQLKVLCATRLGPLGVSGWTAAIEALTASALPEAGIGRRNYVGRPVIVTRNDYLNGVFNGDVGLVVAGTAGPLAAFQDANGAFRELALSRLSDIETWWAMTIHKSQGSEFERVILALPPPPSPVLTRELLYTAVTRAKEQVTVVAAEESLRAAITNPVARPSGLRQKLWALHGGDPGYANSTAGSFMRS